MRLTLILSVIGPDRPGLVDRLSSTIASVGGNWEGGRLLRLSGQFAGMVEVSLAEDALAPFEIALTELESEGLQARLHRPGGAAASGSGGRLLELEVVGQDRPGIVSALSGTLARLGVNVEELATDCGEAPWSGERVFRSRARLLVPDALPDLALRDALEAIALDLMVELKAAEN